MEWSLRDYGIEATVWDGDPECEHEWDIKDRKLHSGRGLDDNNKNQKYSERKTIPDKIISNGFCSKCGAWLGCLGLEPNFELFIKHLCDIYDDVMRVLKPTGTCWVNLGDSYSSSSTKSNWDTFADYRHDGGAGKRDIGGNEPKKRNMNGIPSKCLLMIPQRFAIEMVNRGWILRNVIIWHKPNCMPSSAKDRFTVDFEYVYFFVKSNKTQYWVNEKTAQLIPKQPLGNKGAENIDWEWQDCPKCDGKGKEIKRTKISNTSEANKEPYKQNNPHLLRLKENKDYIITEKECKRCNGSGKIKYSFWSGRSYWFEQQRESIAQTKGNLERRKYKKGTSGINSKAEKRPNDNTKPYNIFEKYTIPESMGRAKRCVWTHESTFTEVFNKLPIETQQLILEQLSDVKGQTWRIPTKPNPAAHFATFPPKLVEPMILSGCPEFVCKECGKPRERIIEKKKWKPTRKHEGKHYKDMLGVSESSAFNHREDWEKFKAENPDKFLGYTDCGCNAGFESGIVLDPFAGTGTTCKTAFNLGRDYIGFEISKEYKKIYDKFMDSTKNKRLTEFL